MKKLTAIVYCSIALVVMAGCSGTAGNSADDAPEPSAESEEVKAENSAAEPPAQENAGDTATEQEDSSPEQLTDEELRARYSDEQIEYARVWQQLGPNQEIDELNVHHIPAGTPINPEDETSAAYPEDVIQLAGSRLVDGSVTYSGNGDGSINVYNVPLRWDGEYPVEDPTFYTDIIESTTSVYIEPTHGEEVIRLAELLNIHP